MLYYINYGILKGLRASTYFYLLLCKQCLFLWKKLFVPYIHIIRIQTNICRQIKARNVSYLRNTKAQMPNSLKVLICKSKIVIAWNIHLLVFMSGRGNSLFQSILLVRNKAGSRLSILFVLRITFTSPLASKPSSWFSNYNMVHWISCSPPECASYLQINNLGKKVISGKTLNLVNWDGGNIGRYIFVPTASISSMKIIEGESSSATRNSSQTNLGPSPKYFWISLLPTTHKNFSEVELATTYTNLWLMIF